MNIPTALIGFFGVIVVLPSAVGVTYYSGRKPEIANDDLEYVELAARKREEGIADNRNRLL
jgi:hypothetical protein